MGSHLSIHYVDLVVKSKYPWSWRINLTELGPYNNLAHRRPNSPLWAQKSNVLDYKDTSLEHHCRLSILILKGQRASKKISGPTILGNDSTALLFPKSANSHTIASYITFYPLLNVLLDLYDNSTS